MKNAVFWDVTPYGSCKNRYFEATYRLHQLFVCFKNAYDSVKREVFYNILIEFEIPMKLVRLTIMC
jgi:hypothetical protein